MPCWARVPPSFARRFSLREDLAVPAEPSTQARQRLASALAEFWYGGDGPSHSEIDAVLIHFGLETQGSKREKVREAIMTCESGDLPEVTEHLTTLLRRRALPNADGPMVGRLRSALNAIGLGLDEHYEVTQTLSRGDPILPAFVGIPALREHVGRIERAIRDADWPLLIGSTKELLESTAKVVLMEQGRDIPTRFPALLTSALECLGLHPRQASEDDPALEQPMRRILGGAMQVALGIDEYRNTHGTGHGRGDVTSEVSTAHVRLAVAAGVAVAVWMLDSLEGARR